MSVSAPPRRPDAAAPASNAGFAHTTACWSCGGHRAAFIHTAGELREVCPDCGAERIVAPSDTAHTLMVVGRAGQKVIASRRNR